MLQIFSFLVTDLIFFFFWNRLSVILFINQMWNIFCRVIHEKSNPNRTFLDIEFGKMSQRMSWAAENALIFFHALKTTACAGNNRHQPEDRAERAAPYSVRRAATLQG